MSGSIHSAAKKGKVKALQAAIISGREDVNSLDDARHTPLWYAARRGSVECVRELVATGASVDMIDKVDKYEDPPLVAAARAGHDVVVGTLAELEASVNYLDMNGRSPLWLAAKKGHTKCVKELISKGATVDMGDENGTTPLMIAAYKGHTDTVEELLSSGASLSHVNNNGETALTKAKRSRISNFRTIKFLKGIIESQKASQATPLLSLGCTGRVNKETKKPMDKHLLDVSQTTTPGCQLVQPAEYPGVTFFIDPQEHKFTSGEHYDFDNGVEVNVPASAVASSASTVDITVQPCFAPSSVIVLPEGIESASPTYLISGEDLKEGTTVSMEHHDQVRTQEEADDLLFLQADTSYTEGERAEHRLQEVPASCSQFTPGKRSGILSRRFSKKQFIKIGRRVKKKKKFKDSSRNAYTVTVYRSPPESTGDRMAIIAVSLYGRLYDKLNKELDNVVIPRDYPDVSREVAHRTIQGSLVFNKEFTKLVIQPVEGWSVKSDKDLISLDEVNRPEVADFKAEELYNYPPRIVCWFFPEENAPQRTTCTISLSDLFPPANFRVPLTPKRMIVDTTKLQEATTELSKFVLTVNDEQFSSAVMGVVSRMEKIITVLRLPLSDEMPDHNLASHTESIKSEIGSISQVVKHVSDECKIESISANIEDYLAKMSTLSHQLCSVVKARLHYSQDHSKETAAQRPVDLVEYGANLLKTVDSLLKDMEGINKITSSKKRTLSRSSSQTLVRPKRIPSCENSIELMDINHPLFNREIKVEEIALLAMHFDNVENYMQLLGLSPSEQTDVRNQLHHGTDTAMIKCLSLWQRRDPARATYRALVKMLQEMRKGDIATKIWNQGLHASIEEKDS